MKFRGFSLAEIVLAMALITIVILTLTALSLQSLKVGRKAQDLTAGELVAEQVIERLVYEAETTPTAPVWGHDNATLPLNQEVINLGTTAFNVTTYASDVADLTAPTNFGAGQRLKLVESLVTWQDAPDGRMSYGRLQVRTARLLHEP